MVCGRPAARPCLLGRGELWAQAREPLKRYSTMYGVFPLSRGRRDWKITVFPCLHLPLIGVFTTVTELYKSARIRINTLAGWGP